MTDKKELCSLFPELINEVEKSGEFTQRALEIIEEISVYAKRTTLFKQGRERGKKFWGLDRSTPSPMQIYRYILRKVAEAPSPLLRDAAVILNIPFLEQALKQRGEADNAETPG